MGVAESRRKAGIRTWIGVVVPLKPPLPFPWPFPGPVLPKGEKPVVGWVVSTGLMAGERMRKYQKAARERSKIMAAIIIAIRFLDLCCIIFYF